VLTSLKSLLASIVDYAGLFPPARLSLPEAVTIYDRTQASPHAWMLDRFVIPASRLPELSQILSTSSTAVFTSVSYGGTGGTAPYVGVSPPHPLPHSSGNRCKRISERVNASKPWSLSVILSKNWATELEQLHQICETASRQSRQINIRALEVAPLPLSEIQQICLNLPAEVEVFFEIPFDRDLEPYLNVLQQTKTAAKLRTGGVTQDAFPDSTQLSQRIFSLAAAQIPFKATAGLHHVLRGDYPLTDEPGSASTTMPGFLNLAILTAFAHQQRITLDEARDMLEERSIAPFQFTDTTIRWRDYSLSVSEIEQARQHFRSFGSCSVQEPIDDLHHLGFL